MIHINEIVLFLTVPMILGFVLDLILGDPYSMPHPIRFIGILIEKTEKILCRIFPKTSSGEFIAGVFLVVIVTGISFSIPILILWLCLKIHFGLAFAIETIMCYQILAVKSLKDESMKVYTALSSDSGILKTEKEECFIDNEERLKKGRHAVSMIVGRDTEDLTEEGIVKATVETIAENTSDGTVAPMIFMAIGGAPLGFLYKAVNTMDSMVGYKNDKYLYFGRFAAKLDDVLNYIPARFAGLFMIFAAYMIGLDGKNAWKIFRRDRHNHASPNSAQTEAACAGALGVQLAGNAYYFGKLYEKKTIGDPIREIQIEDIKVASKLLYATAIISLAVCMIVIACVSLI